MSRGRLQILGAWLVLWTGAGAWTAHAGGAFATHPGQHLSLTIRIADEAVTFEVLLSAELRNLIIPNEYVAFVPLEDGLRYVLSDPDEAARTREAFAAFFREHNSVHADGVQLLPVLERVEFVSAARRELPEYVEEDPAPDALVVLRYPLMGRPRSVSMVWDLYGQDTTRVAMGLDPRVEVVAELDAYDENRIVTFRPDEPEVVWHAPEQPVRERVTPMVAAAAPAAVSVPAISAVAVLGGVVCTGLALLRRSRRAWPAGGAAAMFALAVAARGVGVVQVPIGNGPRVRLPEPAEAVALFTSLHRNVYRAFDYKNEGDIYDVLAQSVDGPLLDQVYNEVYQSLILRDQGGAVARIQNVEILDAQVESSGVDATTHAPAFRVRSRWHVLGAVYHWGHVHARTNEYSALYTIAQCGPHWKITGVGEVEQRRIVRVGDDPPDPREEPAGQAY